MRGEEIQNKKMRGEEIRGTRMMGEEVRYYGFTAVVVGSGAAGYSAADRLHRFGVQSVAMVTEDRKAGTSRNTGSDKQTYYKLTLSGREADSVGAMAKTLFEGGAVDGDLAQCEAALSTRCFLHLTELGVPFPSNEYGEFVGYKTDHDPANRATSAGPLTSRYMTECLERCVEQEGVPVFDHCTVVRILTDGDRATGLLCYSKEEHRFLVFGARHIVYATGGPAGLYSESVYPGSQHGATGLAFEAGASGKNLTEWQYGLASVSFRWNLSGTYQQVLPAYISTAQDGSDEKEFLRPFFAEDAELLNRIFLKGYQWPFDPRKASGSSLLDILVYEETKRRGRRVFLDYRRNPAGLSADFHELNEEAYTYLKKSGALFGTPFERLQKMNPKAIALYRSHGIDLSRERLEIAVCAQHNNGGLSGDRNWESNLRGLYPVGEVNGSHGIYRPGGSALNAGQCGAFRAARKIAAEQDEGVPTEEEVLRRSGTQIAERMRELRGLKPGASTTGATRKRIGERMSRYCAFIRSEKGARLVYEQARNELSSYWETCRIDARQTEDDMLKALQNYDLLIAQAVYAASMADAIREGIESRGSYMVVSDDGTPVYPGIELSCRLDDGRHDAWIQETSWDGKDALCYYRPVRPLPEMEQWFETVYNAERGPA